MKERDFCYWLQGFFELDGNRGGGLTSKQTEMVKEHLALVFDKVTGPLGDSGGGVSFNVDDEEMEEFVNNLRPNLTCSQVSPNPFEKIC